MTEIKRRESFDKVAKIYDLARPGYPKQLIDDVINMANLPSFRKDQEVREIINGHGGYLKRPYLSVLFLAQKQASN